jgi:hypothetical protein
MEYRFVEETDQTCQASALKIGGHSSIRAIRGEFFVRRYPERYPTRVLVRITTSQVVDLNGALAEIRTPDPQIRSLRLLFFKVTTGLAVAEPLPRCRRTAPGFFRMVERAAAAANLGIKHVPTWFAVLMATSSRTMDMICAVCKQLRDFDIQNITRYTARA